MKVRDDSIKGCILLENLTPIRGKSDRIYKCECVYCHRIFSRSRRWIKHGHYDCGCLSGTNKNNTKLINYFLHNLDENQIQKFRNYLADYNEKLLFIFDIVYTNRRESLQTTAMKNYISISNLMFWKKKVMKKYIDFAKEENIELNFNCYNN